jgi:ADP-ribose pyrophosphatase YjhB (NUDIX family)
MRKGIIICADMIARYRGKIVLVERLATPGTLALPGGKWEAGEMLSDTALREFKEETWMRFVYEGVLGTFADDNRDPRGRYVSTVFIGRGYGSPRDEPTKTHVVLADKEQILAQPERFFCDHFRILERYFALRNP